MFLLATLLCGCDRIYSLPLAVKEAPPRGLSEPYKQAVRHIEDGECDKAWKTVWPLVKKNDHGAVRFLAEALRGGMTPPGDVSRSDRTQNRHWLVLFIYATLSDAEFALNAQAPAGRIRDLVPTLISNLAPGAAAQPVSACYASAESATVCQKLAVSAGIVPQLDRYVRETDVEERNGGSPAFCPIEYTPPRLPAR
jgi:hypothetical protein